MTGTEGKPDPVEAFKWLTLAAKRGVPEASVNLARLRPTLTDEQIAAATQQAESFQPRGE